MIVGAESVPPQKYIQKNGADIVTCFYYTSKTTKFTRYELKNGCSLDAERWDSHWSIVTDRAMSSIKKQQRWTSFLSFADYFLAVYSQATVSLTWERAEELVTTQWGRCVLHLLTPAGENRLLKFQESLSQWLNRTITKSKLCELTIKYIILKPKVTNTENSS